MTRITSMMQARVFVLSSVSLMLGLLIVIAVVVSTRQSKDAEIVAAGPDFTGGEIHGDRAVEFSAMSCVELRDDHGRLLVEGLRSLTDLAHFEAEVNDVQAEVQAKSYENMAESFEAIKPLVMVNADRHSAEMEFEINMEDISEVESHIAERCVPDGEYFFRVMDPSQ